MPTATTIRPDARDLAGLVRISEMLRHLGWRVRRRNRAECGLCRGNSIGTLAFTERLWKCHRCNEGGDIFTLVMAVNRCGFPDALKYVVELAGIRVEHPPGANLRREIAERRRERERAEQAEVDLANLERLLRTEVREQIHKAERLLATPGPWSDSQWQQAHAASVLRDAYLLPAFTLLSFGTLAERARYALHPELRAEMAITVRDAGGVRADDGIWVEVLQ